MTLILIKKFIYFTLFLFAISLGISFVGGTSVHEACAFQGQQTGGLCILWSQFVPPSGEVPPAKIYGDGTITLDPTLEGFPSTGDEGFVLGWGPNGARRHFFCKGTCPSPQKCRIDVGPPNEVGYRVVSCKCIEV